MFPTINSASSLTKKRCKKRLIRVILLQYMNSDVFCTSHLTCKQTLSRSSSSCLRNGKGDEMGCVTGLYIPFSKFFSLSSFLSAPWYRFGCLHLMWTSTSKSSGIKGYVGSEYFFAFGEEERTKYIRAIIECSTSSSVAYSSEPRSVDTFAFLLWLVFGAVSMYKKLADSLDFPSDGWQELWLSSVFECLSPYISEKWWEGGAEVERAALRRFVNPGCDDAYTVTDRDSVLSHHVAASLYANDMGGHLRNHS